MGKVRLMREMCRVAQTVRLGLSINDASIKSTLAKGSNRVAWSIVANMHRSESAGRCACKY